jgi:predicted acyl esterase
LNTIETLAIDRREFAVGFLKLAALLALPAAAFPAADSGPFEVAVRRDVRVRMRDGVLLATDVYLPAPAAKAEPARVPAILERTPYGKSQDGTRHASVEVANQFASHGYSNLGAPLACGAAGDSGAR